MKAHLALWLTAQGARHIEVSVDGAEPDPVAIRRIFAEARFTRRPLEKSRAEWTGTYAAPTGTEVIVKSVPGIDVSARFPDGRQWVAECKGEPTASGVKAGQDLTDFYTCLGQLVLRSGDRKILATAKSTRTTGMTLTHKKALEQSGITVLVIHETGLVEEA